MGAESSAQRDRRSQEDASAEELKMEEKSVHDRKPLQKNGQISSMSSLNGHSEDNTLAEVGQPDGVSVAQKEETSEMTETNQEEVAPQLNGETLEKEKESPEADDSSAIEEKAAKEKPGDASEVGFKKIFRFVGFKFTLKKDKSEEKDPVKVLTVKDKEGEDVTDKRAEEESATADEKRTAEEKDVVTEVSTAEAGVSKDTDEAETDTSVAAETTTTEATAAEATDEGVKEEGPEKESESSPSPQENALSPIRKFFSGGLFSNLRKKTSIKKTKEEESKVVAAENETTKPEESDNAVAEEEGKVEETQEDKEEPSLAFEESKPEPTPDPEVTVETPAPTVTTAEETKPEEEKEDASVEADKTPVEVPCEAELQSSQEKVKAQGSPLKKLFTGAGLKKLSTKKQKPKKEAETKLAESGEQAAEQLQASSESTEGQKTDSGPSSPEESGEQVITVEVTQTESSQETEGEVPSDGEKKKEGIIAWSSFKKLVTPKKRVKRSSESEDETAGEKPGKSATLSSSESAALADKSGEEEAKAEKTTEEEPKTENTEKLVSSSEEPKKKMDTSVSWEALMCMGGTKRRTRRTSDSDDDETKIDEEAPSKPAGEGEQEGKTVEATVGSSQNTESDVEGVSSPEPLSTPPSTWDTLKRMVLPKNKAKSEEKTEESAEQVSSDSEAAKDESSFSLRKLFPGRRKKKAEKQASTEHGSGEEDSDTPAVVPLSEYDEQVDHEKEAAVEPVPVQIKVSAEDRSPSWVAATLEDVCDKHDQLSDIPEEVDNTVTPKSADTDAAEDETEDQDMESPKDPNQMGRRLSTAEVKPVAPTPTAETTPVAPEAKSESTEVVLESMQAHFSEIPSQTSVTVGNVPKEVLSEKTECELPTEEAKSTTNTILQLHPRDEAMAICTGLETKEISKVDLEEPAVPIVECVVVIRDALSTEVSVGETLGKPEEAIVTEDEVLNAPVYQVEISELEPAVETSAEEAVETQAATESFEPDIEKVAVVSSVVEESEVVQPTEVSDDSLKVVNPITPTSETFVCTENVEVNEPTVETKEVEVCVDQLAATEEHTPVKDVLQVTASEITTICKTTVAIAKETEPEIPVDVPSEEAPLIAETVVLIGPLSVEAHQLTNTDRVVVDQITTSEPSDTLVEVEEIKEELVAAVTAAATSTEKESEISVQTSEKIEHVEDDVEKVKDIELQSMVITQAVIDDAIVEVSEDIPERSAPAADVSTPVQVVATTEKEMETTTETPVITDTPVPVIYETPALPPKTPDSTQPLHVAMEIFDPIPLEVTNVLEAFVEDEKPEGGLKKAVEVKVSEECVVVEEVVELKAESETGEEEHIKDDAAVQQVEPAPMEENKEKVLDVHMPIQVVLQTAKMVEDTSVEEEAVVEINGGGPADCSAPAEHTAPKSDSLSTILEEPQTKASAEEAASTQEVFETEKAPSGKCAEVMAQVIEVIEEAVKQIEPVSSEVTTAS
ncbi:A-kinase anchor protein 12b isoform X2 [Thalassophryne amazonica]|uniref:A-kinase anchor protein 12b isoform X2 n=1 Tax=Thalassophryne amazonica TaxID=390379 RepID=UPI001470C509|nr:A-kinase anchor protein 12b isoform X2 [Thalassophryne amazonica]